MTTRADADAPAADLSALEGLDLEGLRAAWQACWGAPPKLRSVELLRLMLAWRIQAETQGGLDRDTRRKLARKGRPEAEGLDLGLGARLRRDWQGRRIDVVVTARGFEWEGSCYPSLSKVATAVTGTRWNGPRFFGLRSRSG